MAGPHSIREALFSLQLQECRRRRSHCSDVACVHSDRPVSPLELCYTRWQMSVAAKKALHHLPASMLLHPHSCSSQHCPAVSARALPNTT